jgi:hypothetical protein
MTVRGSKPECSRRFSPNGTGEILMHGAGDTRMGMSGHAPFLLRAGYTVLIPIREDTGASGGDIVTAAAAAYGCAAVSPDSRTP